MKFTKKIVLALVVLALVCTTVFGLVACTKDAPVEAKEFQLNSVASVSNIIAISVDSDIMADVTGKHLIDYLNALAQKDYFAYTTTGGFVTTINKITVDASKNQFWAIYTTDAENSSDDYAAPIVIDGDTYHSANYGIVDMPLKAGEKYLFKVSTY